MEIAAIAKVTVDFYIDAKNLREAEKLLDAWLAPQEDDDRLRSYEITSSDWVPEP